MRHHCIMLIGIAAFVFASVNVVVAAEDTSPAEKVDLISLQKRVEGLEDREAIRQLPIKYVQYIRLRNYEGVAGLFAKGGGFHYKNAEGKDDGAVGAEAIRAFYERTVPISDPWAFVHNQTVEMLDTGHAKGSVYSEIRRGKEKMRLLGVAVYDDTYVKEDGVWKFADRHMTVVPIPKN